MLRDIFTVSGLQHTKESTYRRVVLGSKHDAPALPLKVYSRSLARIHHEFEDNALKFIPTNLGQCLQGFTDVAPSTLVVVNKVNILQSLPLEHLCVLDRKSKSWSVFYNGSSPKPQSPHVLLSDVERHNPITGFYESYRPLITMYAGLVFMGSQYYNINETMKSLEGFTFNYSPLNLRNFVASRIRPEEEVIDTLAPLSSSVIRPTTREGQKAFKINGFLSGLTVYYPNNKYHSGVNGDSHVYLVSDVAPFRLLPHQVPSVTSEEVSIRLDSSVNPLVALRRDILKVSVFDIL